MSHLFSRSHSSPPPPSTLAIIGCGFAGLSVLAHVGGCPSLAITLFDHKDYFEYTPSILRAMACPEHMDKILVPLSSTRAARFTRVHALVSSLSLRSHGPASLTAGGQRYEFDYVIIAVGSLYADLIKPDMRITSLADRRATLLSIHDSLAACSLVRVIGGGLVGVELAAEIAEFFPSKHVELRCRGSCVLPDLPPTARSFAHSWLVGHGVRVVFESAGAPSEYRKHAQTDEIVFDCTGNKPQLLSKLVVDGNNSSSSPSSFISSVGLYEANRFLQLTDRLTGQTIENVFCIGDCAGDPNGAAKMAYTAELQAEAASNNLLHLLYGRPLQPYPEQLAAIDTLPTLLVCSLGSTSGVIVFNSICVCGPLSALVKWFIETSKLMTYKGYRSADCLWAGAERVVFAANRWFHKIQKFRGIETNRHSKHK